MAYRSRATTRRAPARRSSYAAPRRPARRNVGTRRARALAPRAQRLVIQVVQAPAAASPLPIGYKEGPAPRKAKI